MNDALLLRAMELLDEQPPPPLTASQQQAVSVMGKAFTSRERIAA